MIICLALRPFSSPLGIILARCLPLSLSFFPIHSCVYPWMIDVSCTSPFRQLRSFLPLISWPSIIFLLILVIFPSQSEIAVEDLRLNQVYKVLSIQWNQLHWNHNAWWHRELSRCQFCLIQPYNEQQTHHQFMFSIEIHWRYWGVEKFHQGNINLDVWCHSPQTM